MAIRLLRRSARTVARPQGVSPTTCVPVWLQRKWYDHRCRLGLNNVARLLRRGSVPSIWTPLKPLHSRQAMHKFLASVSPPCERGVMCARSQAFRRLNAEAPNNTGTDHRPGDGRVEQRRRRCGYHPCRTPTESAAPSAPCEPLRRRPRPFAIDPFGTSASGFAASPAR